MSLARMTTVVLTSAGFSAEFQTLDGELLDHSEVDLIRRTILSAGKDPDDPAIVEHYSRCYLRMLKAFRFLDCAPASSVPQ